MLKVAPQIFNDSKNGWCNKYSIMLFFGYIWSASKRFSWKNYPLTRWSCMIYCSNLSFNWKSNYTFNNRSFTFFKITVINPWYCVNSFWKMIVDISVKASDIFLLLGSRQWFIKHSLILTFIMSSCIHFYIHNWIWFEYWLNCSFYDGWV